MTFRVAKAFASVCDHSRTKRQLTRNKLQCTRKEITKYMDTEKIIRNVVTLVSTQVPH